MVALHEWEVRTARADDLDALVALAGLTGGGFTNLPADRAALERRLAVSSESLAADVVAPGNEMYMLVLCNRPTGRVGGTASIFARVGTQWPFYSYRLATIALHSPELKRTFRTGVLNLVNDFDGAAEVGGLFLPPDLRAGGLGRLLARARYLFIARHRARIADRCVAELRGVIRQDGSSPFWDGLAGRFFGMDFVEADRFNSLHGNQFIADLMPKYPVYEALLPDCAAAVIGVEHPAGRGARKLLEAEGFRYNRYIDIFDGGPTLDIETDRIGSVATATAAEVVHGAATGSVQLVAGGRLASFRAMAAPADVAQDSIRIAPETGFAAGESVTHVAF